MLRNRILELAEDRHTEMIGIRRHLHMHPELSFHEEKTSAYIQEILRTLEIPFTTGWAGFGVVGILEGNKPDSGVIALRADMDALPIQEENAVSYSSTHPGIMHACGHDVHTASLLGAATILADIRNRFDGTVKLIFQPAEEKLPGGASIMISEGVLKDPVPTGILGQHVHPPLSAGTVGFREGVAMASADEITLKIFGKGGHGAMPHLTIDPVAVSAQVITALQQVISRNADPLVPSVLTFGKIASDGGAFNVIPGSVEISGTFRTFDEQWRKEAHARIREIAQGVAGGYGAKCDVTIDRGYPVLQNDPGLTRRCRAAAEELLGKDRVHDIPQRLTAEDFAYYTHETPGCFYRLGVGNQEKGIVSPVHTPTFDIDETALKTGAGLLAWLAVTNLVG